MKYYIETIRDEDGAPMGFREVSKEKFDSTVSIIGYEPFEHTVDEIERLRGVQFEGGVVKLVFV